MGLVYKKKNVMNKKSSMVMVAFVLGALISITIQACGGDENKFDGSGNFGSSTNCECSWVSQNIDYSETCDENGEITSRVDYAYDNRGRMIESKVVHYVKGYPSGKRHLAYTNYSTYTYSDSDDCRYGRIISIYYNEDGSVRSEDRSSDKLVLYKK